MATMPLIHVRKDHFLKQNLLKYRALCLKCSHCSMLFNLLAWAPAGRWSRVSGRPPPPPEKTAIWGTFFCYFFLHIGAFLLRFSPYRQLV